VTATKAGRTTLIERRAAAYPVVLAYVLLLTLYAWQTSRHSTPWLFTDELEWAEESRGIAHHGVAQLRGQDVGFSTLYPYLIAPAWWASGTSSGYAAAKYINAAITAAVLFPGYGLARLFLRRSAALVCAVATAAIPAAAYAGLLIPDPLAYFFSTLALWLVARALLRRTIPSVIVAVAALVAAPYVKSELIALVLAAAVALFAVALTGAQGRALISRWRPIEKLGAAGLGVGVLMYLGAAVSHHSETWATGTYYHHRMFEYGLWAVGAFTIGVGVLPVVVALAWLLGNRFGDVRERIVGGLLLGSVSAFGIYTAVKASKLSTVFAIRVEERNFIFVAPVVFLSVAVWATAGRIRVVPLILSAGAVAYLLNTTPYHNTEDFYSDAPGLSVLQWLNREFYFTTTDARRLLFGILFGTVAILVCTDVLVRRRRVPRLAGAAGALLALLVIGWNLWGEAAAASASNRFSAGLRSVIPTPPDWIDQTTRRHRTLFIGQSLGNSNAFWSLEFWNQSMHDLWSVDASTPGPGPTITPDYADTTGVIRPQLPLDWMVTTPGIDPVGTLVAPVGGLRLFRVPHPIRLTATTLGLSPDASWMSTAAAYVRFGARTVKPGVATVSLSRLAACGGFASSPITIRITRLVINTDRQPAPGQLLAERRVLIRSNPCDTKVFRFPVRPPFRIDLSASRTFQPSASDPRQLSAQVSFGFAPAKG
jgi:hypothetical protein